MAEDIADAVRRYWAIIVTVIGAMIVMGNIYVSVLRDIDAVRSDLHQATFQISMCV